LSGRGEARYRPLYRPPLTWSIVHLASGRLTTPHSGDAGLARRLRMQY